MHVLMAWRVSWDCQGAAFDACDARRGQPCSDDGCGCHAHASHSCGSKSSLARLLSSCELGQEAAGNIVSSLFQEDRHVFVLQKQRQVQTVRHSSVRQLVLSCVKAWEMRDLEA